MKSVIRGAFEGTGKPWHGGNDHGVEINPAKGYKAVQETEKPEGFRMNGGRRWV